MVKEVTKRINSFTYAGRGIKSLWRNEVNFRIEVLAAIIVVFFMFYFQITYKEAVVLIIAIGAVLILEILNTVMERITDILKPKISDYVAVLKDMMAAAVLLTSLGALIIGVLIFYPYIFN